MKCKAGRRFRSGNGKGKGRKDNCPTTPPGPASQRRPARHRHQEGQRTSSKVHCPEDTAETHVGRGNRRQKRTACGTTSGGARQSYGHHSGHADRRKWSYYYDERHDTARQHQDPAAEAGHDPGRDRGREQNSR